MCQAYDACLVSRLSVLSSTSFLVSHKSSLEEQRRSDGLKMLILSAGYFDNIVLNITHSFMLHQSPGVLGAHFKSNSLEEYLGTGMALKQEFSWILSGTFLARKVHSYLVSLKHKCMETQQIEMEGGGALCEVCVFFQSPFSS